MITTMSGGVSVVLYRKLDSDLNIEYLNHLALLAFTSIIANMCITPVSFGHIIIMFHFYAVSCTLMNK